MANNRIKGITIEIGGETTALQNALKDVNKQSVDLQKELKDVERLLKFDPGNAEALAQKQQLLTKQIENTTQKLEQLKSAQYQVEAQFNSGQIGETAYRSFRRELEFTEAELGKLKDKLATVDDGKAIKNLKQDAEEAKDSMKELGGEMAGIAAGLAAGGGIAGAIDSALSNSSLKTKIDITLEVPEESKKSVKEAISSVTAYGVDAEEALEGVRRQWALNKNASDESNQAVAKGAATIAAAYSGIDFNELIQETNEISKALNISNEEALGLTNALLKMGFPPEQLDIISEYGTQLKMAGFSAAEIQALFAAGVETGTWNIDNLLDGLKEGRIRVAEFGQEVPKAMQELLQGTDISAKQMQKWGKAVAAGGEGGTKALQEIALALQGVDDETKKNALGVQIFGTMYEDQGQNIINTLLNAKKATVDLKAGQDELNSSTAKLNADPAVQMQKAVSDLKTALGPLLEVIAQIISKIAEWVSNNPQLAATITAVASAVGIIMGLLMALSPIITAATAAAGAMGISVGALVAPIAIAIAAIAAIIAIGVLLYKNWDEIKVKASEIWEAIKNIFSSTLTAIKGFFVSAWESIKSTTATVFNAIKSFIETIWTGIKGFIETVLGVIKVIFQTQWTIISTVIKTAWEGIKTVISTYLNLIKGVIKAALQLLTGDWEGAFNTIKSTAASIMNNIVSFFRSINLVETGKDIIQGLINGISSMAGAVIEKAKALANSIKNTIKDALDINSPSKVMEKEIGRWIPEGLAQGMTKNLGVVLSASEKMANVAIPDAPNMGTVTTSETVNHYTLYATINAKDLKEVKEMSDIFNSLTQKSRALGVR